MKVTSKGIENGIIRSEFGMYGTCFDSHHIPCYSLPFRIEDAPHETVSYAFVLEDKDAYPVTGFTWIHWIGANLTRKEVYENESLTASDFIQGANSWISIQGNELSIEQASFYGGMTPPDKSHMYELHVYALDQLLDLQNGFYLNELFHKMSGHILGESVLKGIYQKIDMVS
ncbi:MULTISPECIES: YbhB/YbcL family Raf kinase inhibitor-like protein [Bacillota]|jgi:Raf kinase inhibitor-like YbhB/YbcL family protein|uniref:YbhB/YbcL family Raf kinase inhibitor-like protein n=1 Tax=[Eubacterium] hominis TaxID=2764325 RepID=A0A7G9GRN3_9FIRM|nr:MULTISPECIES: YbhB/YbcL family Raf kinase inhibitor-like protein [Bacillota]QNM13465.1 YbhB/YbcL family Raf kinase inhibitor-like protein [[Eubacterium] hominis]RGB51700.1 YbhB/YbcL family Raf kinase inhibitor-like protein [Absiella sp. AM22-9]RGB57228.1 YbhB/YbcL family Raf kinase inhibitor-like protein [Absiella sp. AM10-20]RGB68511.1 YbhB/YbcL family Raf kinase inhibitor-like protein [Absiella sp. AM09-45]RGB78378.1 YbhB/YbcL family Raf kinase inhibitor-like protein [Absiella sp. AM09-50